jgi:sugar O-acyltransferase (sialic acid O-acetyltransferase NeuD family)
MRITLMPDALPILIPLLNPNEPEALLAALHVAEGQQVAPGDLICTLETTKSAADLPAEAGGYVVGLRFQQGQTVPAGAVLGYLAEDPAWQPPQLPPAPAQAGTSAELPAGLRITQPALALARQLGLDLARLPVGPLVTEQAVRQAAGAAAAPALSPPQSAFDPTAILVYGGGGHGKTLVDLLRALGAYRMVGIIDDGLPPGQMIMGLEVLGGAEALPELHARGVRLAVNAVGGIGSLAVRLKVFHKLAQAGFACPAVIHPRAWVEPSAALAAGVQVFAHAYVGSQAQVGYGAIINTGAIVSHDCVVGDSANLSPGAILAGEVHVGAGALIGMGATVNLQAHIGPAARIGNGATVKTDVPENGIVRAGATWP